MSDYDDDYNGPEFETEVRALDRVGFGLLGDINDIRKTPKEKFIYTVNTIANNIIKNHSALSSKDLPIILEKIDYIENPGFKNAEAYVLGYIATQGANNFSTQALNKAYKLMQNVNQTDVIRYGRFWLLHLNKYQ